MRCSKCGNEIEGTPKFCPECGSKFVPIPAAVPVPGDESDLFYCYRHKKEPTRVTCGRCGRPLCPRCLVISPAGVRCRQCAKGHVKMRPRGLAHDATSLVSRVFGSLSRTPGGYWIVWLVITLILSGALCGRHR